MAAATVPEIPRYYITLSYMYGLFEYLKQENIPLAPVLAAIGLQEEELEDGDRLLPATAMETAFETAAVVAGDPLLGFHAGQCMRPGHLGMVGHMVLCCETADELLQLLCRYGELLGNGMQNIYDNADGQVLLRQCIHPPERVPNYSLHCRLYNLTGWLTLCRWLGGPDLTADFVDIPHPKTMDDAEVRKFMGCDFRFDKPELRVGFSEQFLQRAFLQASKVMKPMLEAALRERQQLLQSHQQALDPFVAKIRQLIANHLLKGTPELQDIAQAAGEPARRLQYFLESRNTNFKQLVDEVRKEMAAKHIRDDTLSLIEVALMLGFSDQSTFQRAFKRWYGTRPGEYRKMLKAGGAA